MASRRVGLDNSSAGKAVQKATGLSNALFGGTAPQLEEPKKVEEEVKEEAPKKVEEKPKKETKAKVVEEVEEKEELIRQTYFLTPVLIEAIRIMSFNENTKKNEMVRKLISDAIPGSIIAEAKENVKKFSKKK